MTPAQHKTAAEALLSAFETPSPERLAYTNQSWLAAAAHAQLGRATGTGAHYSAADGLLAAPTSNRVQPDHLFLRAFTHALLADQ